MASPSDQDFLLKILLYVGGIAGAAGLGYVFVNGLVNPPTKGGSCTTPGTNCYECAQPYVVQYNTLMQQYAQQYQMFLVEDNANGTSLTTSQQATLDGLQASMTSAAQQIAACALSYSPSESGATILATDIGEGALIALGAIGLAGAAALFLKWTTSSNTVASAVSKIQNSIIQSLADDGEISQETGAAISSTVSSNVTTNTEAEQTELSTYVDLGVLTQTAAEDIASSDAAAMEADASEVESALADIGEAGAAAATPLSPEPFSPSLAYSPLSGRGCGGCGGGGYPSNVQLVY